MEWLARIKHPQAKTLLEFDRVTASRVAEEEAVSRQNRTLQLRRQQRERTKRHRDWYRGRLVYPGDWLSFKDAADFAKFYGKKHPLPTVCAGLEDSPRRADLSAVLDRLSCGRALAGEPYWYYHRTQHVAHCSDCQAAEWIADGYEVEFSGYPTTWWGPADTREERLAARKRHYQEESERDQRWFRTPKGQLWLAEAEARLKAKEGESRSRG